MTDKTGAAIAGAKVTIMNAGQAVQRETQTSPSGEYSFLALPPGSYNLLVEKSGFRLFQRTNIELAVDVPTTSNVSPGSGTTSGES